MAYMKLDYSQLDKSADNASKTADSLRTYANDIQNKVGNKAGGVTGGSNGYTSAVVGLASQKAQDLRKKADSYDSLKTRLETLHQSAEQADKRVAQKLTADQKNVYQNLSWLDKLLVNIHGVVDGIWGESEIGRLMNNIFGAGSIAGSLMRNAVKKAKDWLVHGKGRYWLNIACAVGAAVSAILAIVGTGGLVLVAAVIAAVVAVAVAVVTIADNFTALSADDDNPGYAKHMGKTDSMESYAKKHFFNKDVQNLFRGIDIVGKLASIARDGAGFFKTTGAGGATKYSFKKDVLKKNLAEKIGFTDTSKMNASTLEKAKSGWHKHTQIGGKDYYLTPRSCFNSAFGLKPTADKGSKSWAEKTTWGKITTGGGKVSDKAKQYSSYYKVATTEAKELRKHMARESTWKSNSKYVLKHTPVIKDGWGILDNATSIFGVELLG